MFCHTPDWPLYNPFSNQMSSGCWRKSTFRTPRDEHLLIDSLTFTPILKPAPQGTRWPKRGPADVAIPPTPPSMKRDHLCVNAAAFRKPVLCITKALDSLTERCVECPNVGTPTAILHHTCVPRVTSVSHAQHGDRTFPCHSCSERLHALTRTPIIPTQMPDIRVPSHVKQSVFRAHFYTQKVPCTP